MPAYLGLLPLAGEDRCKQAQVSILSLDSSGALESTEIVWIPGWVFPFMSALPHLLVFLPLLQRTSGKRGSAIALLHLGMAIDLRRAYVAFQVMLPQGKCAAAPVGGKGPTQQSTSLNPKRKTIPRVHGGFAPVFACLGLHSSVTQPPTSLPQCGAVRY